MAVLEALFAAFAPKMAAKRNAFRVANQYSRGVLGRSPSRMYYDGATNSHRNYHWRPVGTDANAETRGANQTLRNVSRDLHRNNPWAARINHVITSNTIGTGIIPTAHASSKRLVKNLEELMMDHFDTPNIDAHGQNTLYGLQALVMSSVIESGEALVRFRQRRTSDRLPVPFQIEVLEADYLDTSKDGELTNGGIAIQGIEYDRIGRVVAYWLFDSHPGSSRISSTTESRRVPAEFVAHVYRPDRPGQARGVTWLAPVITRLHDLYDYNHAQLVRQKIAACFAAFIESDNIGFAAADETTESGTPLEVFEPGTIERLAPGESVKFNSPPPVSDLSVFQRHYLQEIAAGCGISYEAMTGDLSGTNFSSGRMGWLEFQRNIEHWRHNMLMPLLLWKVERWFLQAASIEGVRPGASDRVRIKWTPPRREMISPKDELGPMVTAIRAGLMTRSEVIRKLGYDPLQVDEEFVTDFERVDELELIFDTDSRQRTTSGGSLGGTESAAEAEPDEGESNPPKEETDEESDAPSDDE